MWVLVLCVFWGILANRMASKKGLNVILWTTLGVLFGPIPLIVLAFKKKIDSNERNGSFADQAADSIRTIRYSVDNISSRVAESNQGQSANKIASALKDAFRK